MATSSLLGGDRTPRNPSGTDVASLGPSDLSDSGSDTRMGANDPETLDSDSDSLGTGERASADGRSPAPGADILPDHLEGDEPRTEDEQAELDFDADEVAEQAEEAASRDLSIDDPNRVDTSVDVRGLAQDEGDEEHGDGGVGSDGPAAPHLADIAKGGGGPGHDIGRGAG